MSIISVENTSVYLELNKTVPDFEAQTTAGFIHLSEWQRNKWVILFSHPADFTPVCTTELIEFAKRHNEFKQRNVALLGCSVDSIYSHIAWSRNIQDKFNIKIDFPIIADLDQKVSRLYGMIHESSSNTSTVRCVFFIDPKRILRAMIYYPMNVGRNFDEIMRMIDALQMADANKVACPANWTLGKEVIIPAPVTMSDAEQRAEGNDYQVTDWYFATKRLPDIQLSKGD
ncbi:MAG: peroxiredoxin [Methyloglobulus sp.]|nr:peroxiredoxin [Methyloglobulus sp.]